MSKSRDSTPPNNKALMAAKISLGIIGAGAGMLYKGPSEVCITQPECGQWLANTITPAVAQGIYTAGGVDFSMINAFMSFNSIDRFKAYLDKQTSTKAKALKGSWVILFAISLDTGLLLTTFTTSKVWWESMLTTLGGLPGSLYAAVGLTEHQIPLALDVINRGLLFLKKNIVDHLVYPTEYELLCRDRITHYRNQQYYFTQTLNRKFEYRKRHYDDLPLQENTDMLVQIIQQPLEFKASLPRKFVRGSSQVVGVAMGGYVSSIFAKNMYSNTHKFVPYMPLAIPIAAYLSISGFYNQTTITGHGARSLADLCYDRIAGEHTDTLSAEFRPKITAAVMLAALALSVFSYAVMNLVFNAEFPDNDNNTIHDGFRITADTGINLYHFFGLMHFWGTIYHLLSKNGVEKNLAEAEALVQHVEKMTLNEFIQFVENNEDARNIKLGIYKRLTPVKEPSPAFDDEAPLLLSDSYSVQEKNASRCLTLFGCCKRKKEDRLQGALNFSYDSFSG